MEGNDDVASNAQLSQPEPYCIENVSPLPAGSVLCPKSRMPVWLSKEKSVFPTK